MSLHIQSDLLKLEVNPQVGASLVAFEAKIGGQWIPIMRPTPKPLPDKSSNYSSFILAPYSNRIRAAKFAFGSKEYQLKPTTPEGNSQHGDVRGRPWKTAQFDEAALICSFDSREFPDFNWPWPLTMQMEYRLEDNRLDTVLELSNVANEPMPAGFGLHPYFMRELSGSGDAVLQFAAKGVYLTDESFIPNGPMSTVPAELDFSKARAVAGQSLNHVYGGWDGRLGLEWPGTGVRMDMEADPIFSHLVVFTSPDGTLALEPVSNATDGFNLMAKGVEGTGVVVLQPGETLKGAMRLSIEGF